MIVVIALLIVVMIVFYLKKEPVGNLVITKVKQKQSKSKPESGSNLVFLDVQPFGRIVIELFDQIVPHTARNFRQLCQNKFSGSPFHRVIKGFMIQGGDITNGDGTGGYSIYGQNFPDENFVLKHDRAGLLSMANAGPNTNGSQFFILTGPAPHLDGKHVVFGRVVSGMEVVSAIENLQVDQNDRPLQPCIISNCGQIVSGKS